MFWIKEEALLRAIQIIVRSRKKKESSLADRKRFAFGLLLEILDYETERYEIKIPLHRRQKIAKWLTDLIVREQKADRELIKRIVKYICQYLGFRTKVREEIEKLI